MVQVTNPDQLKHHILRSMGLKDESLDLLAPSCFLIMPRRRPLWKEQSPGLVRDQALMTWLELLGPAIPEAKLSLDCEVN